VLAPATLVAAESSLEYLNSHRKRDDFTLSFLQAVYFLRTSRPAVAMPREEVQPGHSERVLELAELLVRAAA
jgi:hypothetical protein